MSWEERLQMAERTAALQESLEVWVFGGVVGLALLLIFAAMVTKFEGDIW